MKTYLVLVAFLPVVTGIAARQTLTTEPDEVATKGYSLPDSTKVDIVGVCDVGVSDVRCWDTDGSEIASIAEQVKAYYIIQNSSDVGFRFGKKNRYVVVRAPDNNFKPNSYRFQGVTTTAGTYLSEAGQVRSQTSDGVGLRWYRYTGEKTDTQGALIFDHVSPSSVPEQFDCKVGEVVNLNGLKGKVESIRLQKDNSRTYIPFGESLQNWQIELKFEKNFNPKLEYSASLTQPVLSYVDGKGNPVKLSQKQQQENYMGPRKYFQASCYAYKTEISNVLRITTNVNPGKISRIGLSYSHHHRVLVKDFPLDPK